MWVIIFTTTSINYYCCLQEGICLVIIQSTIVSELFYNMMAELNSEAIEQGKANKLRGPISVNGNLCTQVSPQQVNMISAASLYIFPGSIGALLNPDLWILGSRDLLQNVELDPKWTCGKPASIWHTYIKHPRGNSVHPKQTCDNSKLDQLTSSCSGRAAK